MAMRQERREGGAGAWHCFDDNAVDSWDVANLERDCFGGRFTADMWDPKLGKHVAQVTLPLLASARALCFCLHMVVTLPRLESTGIWACFGILHAKGLAKQPCIHP